MHFCFRSLVKSTSAEATLSLIVAVTHIAAISVIAQTSPVQNPNMTDNPLLTESSLPYHIPPFDKIKDEHFEPAIKAGMREELKEVEGVANDSEKPTFDNTIVALEHTGRLLDRAERTFSNLNACNTNPTLQKIETEIAPQLSAHRDAIHLNGKLFARIQELYDNRDNLCLDPESAYPLARNRHGSEFDTRNIVTRTAQLRAENAKLLGYANWAAYQLEDQTAHDVPTVNKLLSDLAPPAVANAKLEAADMQKIVDQQKGGFQIASGDWPFYSEKVRKARYAFDESELRPYYELNHVILDGVFFAAGKLYGLTFKERHDIPVYQPDVRVFEVYDRDGKPLALFLGDYYARPSKRGGAWMNAYVRQNDLFATKPVVANHLNIPKLLPGEPTLLTHDEVRTAFHEFGHALHGMFSKVKYPRFSGTSVPRDFVEYPSQVNEMWATWPEVLKNYAKHYKTGEPIPQALLDKVIAAAKFNQGYKTTEYLSASLLDQAWHQLNPPDVPQDAVAFEAEALHKAGVDFPPVPPRYRSSYFSHAFAGGYSAGYYSYLWSEVLDADTVEWFKEHGGLKRENGDRFRAMLLSRR